MTSIHAVTQSAKTCGFALAGFLFFSACSSKNGSGSGQDGDGQESATKKVRTQERSEVYRSVKEAVWMVYTHNAGGGGAQGLAFMTDPSGVLVTNFQMLADAYGEVDPVSITVENFAGRQLAVIQVLARSAEGDYVALRIRPRAGESFPVVRISATEPQVGDECYAIGSQHGGADSIVKGTIGGYRDGRDYIKTTARVDAGSTGGPLLNTAGEVVGITTASGKTGSNLALNIRHIRLPTLGTNNRRMAHRQTEGAKAGEATGIQREADAFADGISDTTSVARKKAAAHPRLEELPSTPVGEGEHERVKNAIGQYFSAARGRDYRAMEAALAPLVNRFFGEQYIRREAAVASSREYDAKNSTRVLAMDLRWEKAAIRALPEGYICTIPMDYSVSFRGEPKSFRLAMTLGLSEDFQINYIAEKVVVRQK